MAGILLQSARSLLTNGSDLPQGIMSIRWKLNLSVIALIAVFLFAVAFVMNSVGENARLTREFSRMRTLSQFTADVRTDIYSHQSAVRDNPAADSEMVPAWPSSLLEDIAVQIRLAQSEGERRSWEQVFQAVTESTDSVQSEERAPRIHAWVARAEHELRKLRNLYDVREHDLIAMAARTSLRAHTAIWVACALTVLL